MPRSYRHIKEYENFMTRYNRKQDKIAAGIAIKRKGRPPKDYVVIKQDKVAELKYILARKDAKIQSFIYCQKKEIP